MSARHRCAMVGAGRRSAIVRSRLVVAIAGSFAAASTPAQVTPERLLNAADEPANWLNYSATYDNQRYSALDEITRENVGELELQWIWQARSLEKFEATPLVVDGVVYTVQAPNDIVALDAATGRVFWTYHHENDPGAGTCCGLVNRGLAIWGVLGAAFAYYVIFPPAAKYLLGLGSDFRLLLKADDYFDFIIIVMLGMGVVFQMPAITYVLARIGLVTAGLMVRIWKTALIVILISAAILSPTNDIPNMMLFAAPMLVLYVISIFIAWIFNKPRTAT